MSGSSLDGSLSGERREKSYEPGEYPPEHELASTLVRLYFNEKLNSVHLDSAIEDFTAQLLHNTQEDFDPHRFLDTVVKEASAERGSVSSCQSYPGRFFTALVQSLYNIGYNGFNLDVGLLCPDVAVFGSALSGDPERENLRVEITADYVGDLCTNTDDVEVVLHGDACIAGFWAYSSELTILGSIKLTNIANNNRDCIFRIQKPDPCESMLLEYLDELSENVFDPIIAYLGNKGFWNNGNSLYIPDEDGNWKEVRP